MNYSELKIKKKFLGKKLQDHNKSFILTDDMDTKEKKYIFNMITKQVFILTQEDIEAEGLVKAPVVEEKKAEKPAEPETKVVEVVISAPAVIEEPAETPVTIISPTTKPKATKSKTKKVNTPK